MAKKKSIKGLNLLLTPHPLQQTVVMNVCSSAFFLEYKDRGVVLATPSDIPTALNEIKIIHHRHTHRPVPGLIKLTVKYPS